MNILVTGGSSGLGKSIVSLLSDQSENNLFFTYNRNETQAQSLVYDKKNVVAIKCDFMNEDEIVHLGEIIRESDLDVLINNVYVGPAEGKHFHKTEPDYFLKSFENNLVPTIKITQNALSVFRAKKYGKIINILTAYLINLPPIGFSVYTANKAYLYQLSKSWNSEYAKYNITSNCISPELMLTNLSTDIDERILEQIVSAHPLKKLLTTDEVAESVNYLVKSSQQINGTNLVINAAKNVE